MNDHAKAWVDALRSGEFRQATGYLRDFDEDGPKYCCLGVACEMYRHDTGNGEWEDDDFFVGDVHGVGVLPEPVQEWIGLTTPSGQYQESGQLTIENDAGATFLQIADLIESAPEGLFA